MKNLNKPFLFFAILLFIATPAVYLIEAETARSFLFDLNNWLVALTIAILIISATVVNKAMNIMKYTIQKSEGVLVDESEEDDFVTKLLQKLSDARPIEEEAEIDLHHDYDGITELDNNLPPWWLAGFYLSMVFAVIYLLRFHVLETAPLQAEEYAIAMQEAAKEKEEYLKNAANLVDERNVVALTGQKALLEGAAIFNTSCAVCHANDGGGGVGPNLTDNYWLHGGGIEDIFSTVKYGVPAKGMIPWKDQMGAADMQKVSSYILSLVGTTPANPKEAQGDLYTAPGEEMPEEVKEEAKDSTVVVL